ncbi:hypothetical protein JRQ81_007226 [Phrynocephalus forsythii]|uniref:Mitochondrial fission factor n=1 Tax=Phrynocephalus forsythii TaxID=171643 RepID=A0A9Q0XET6_9SAUR|nr:hypothetical protein JRQ81_007226 [Phrynocephalus forsythii]
MVYSASRSRKTAALLSLFLHPFSPSCAQWRMWPVWSAHLDRTSCDLSFTEAISQRMQVPSHLKVADSAIMAGEQRPPEEDCSPSFQMHVPERLLLSEMMEVASRTPFGCGRTNGWGVADETLFEPSDQAAVYGERPFLTLISQAASQKRRHQFSGYEHWPGGVWDRGHAGDEEAGGSNLWAAPGPGGPMCGVAPEGAPLLFRPGASLSLPPVALAEKMRTHHLVRWAKMTGLEALLAVGHHQHVLCRFYCPHPRRDALGRGGCFC